MTKCKKGSYKMKGKPKAEQRKLNRKPWDEVTEEVRMEREKVKGRKKDRTQVKDEGKKEIYKRAEDVKKETEER